MSSKNHDFIKLLIKRKRSESLMKVYLEYRLFQNYLVKKNPGLK